MDELDELDAYNGNTEHYMWVNFTYQENSTELLNIFDEDVVDDFINNLNDWN